MCACPQRDMRLAEKKHNRAVKKEVEDEEEDDAPTAARMHVNGGDGSGSGVTVVQGNGGAVSLKRGRENAGKYELKVSPSLYRREFTTSEIRDHLQQNS